MTADISRPLPNWPLSLYFDGQCPLCLREIQLFRKRNRQGRLELLDISTAEVAPLPGLTREQMLGCLHARFANGSIVSGIDATYWSYHAVGLGWLVKPLAWRWARPLWQWGYRQFCRLRPHLAAIIPMPPEETCVSGQCRARNTTDTPKPE